jgi:hypothetical protein
MVAIDDCDCFRFVSLIANTHSKFTTYNISSDHPRLGELGSLGHERRLHTTAVHAMAGTVYRFTSIATVCSRVAAVVVLGAAGSEEGARTCEAALWDQ